MEHFLKQKLFLALIVFGVITMASPVLAVGISVGYPNPIPLLAGENLYYGASTGTLGNLILLQVNSATKFSVDPTGAISIYGDIKPGGVSCANNQILQKNSTGTNWVCATLPVVTGDNLGNHTATQILSMGNFKITNLATPTLATDAATMAYVDAKPGDNLGNHTATANLNMNTTYKITNLAVPTLATDATTKAYVDTAVVNTGWADDGTVVRLITATDNVGIGTASAARKLSILDGTTGPIVSLSGLTTNYRGLSLRQSSTDAENWFTGANTSNNFVIRRNGATDDLIIDSTGALSIYGDIKPGGVSCANNQILQKIAGVWSCAAVTGDNLGNHTATANLNMNTAYKITNLATPTLAADAATMAYVDAKPGDNLGNHTATANLNMNTTYKITNLAVPTLATDATTKAYVDARPGDNLGNHTATINLNMNGKQINGLPVPSVPGDATTKTYVDTAIAVATPNLAGWSFSDDLLYDDGTQAIISAYADGWLRLNPGGSFANGVVIVGTGGLSVTQGPINMGNNKITALATPTLATDATTKAYVDTAVVNTGWADDGTVVRLITATDNVGIGTTNPLARLHIQGSGTGNVLLGSWPGDAIYGSIYLNGSTANADYNFVSSPSDTNLYINRPSGKSIKFREANNASDQMVITTGGNVGIGVASPAYRLDVANNTHIGNNLTVDNNLNVLGNVTITGNLDIDILQEKVSCTNGVNGTCTATGDTTGGIVFGKGQGGGDDQYVTLTCPNNYTVGSGGGQCEYYNGDTCFQGATPLLGLPSGFTVIGDYGTALKLVAYIEITVTCLRIK